MKHTRRFLRSKRYLCWLRSRSWLRDNPPKRKEMLQAWADLIDKWRAEHCGI